MKKMKRVNLGKKMLILIIAAAMIFTFMPTLPISNNVNSEAKAASSVGSFKITKGIKKDTSVKLYSTKSANAKYYRIYAKTSKNGKYKNVVNKTSANIKTVTGLKKGAHYYFKIRAINGKSSKASNVKEYTTTGGTTSTYKTIKVAGGDLSGSRKANVKVDVGHGSRVYWAYTNKYGQLVKVTASTIKLQNDNTENVTSSGRYYRDEAKVPGVERKDLDEGHVIADSLGGNSNAYNICPENFYVNRWGQQAAMERAIRKAGGATDFKAIIKYSNTKTQIPSKYYFTFKLKGTKQKFTFSNKDPR